MRRLLSGLALAALLAAASGKAFADRRDREPLPIKVVLVTMFEVGEDEGDEPGELQTWVERLPLPESVAFPQGWRDLRLNREMGVLAIVTGEGTARSAASIMALGMDPRFDLGRAYWLVAGIAGVDPADASLGSAAWAEWVVDGSLKHEIDAREMPPDWPTGSIPLDAATPYPQPLPDSDGVVFRLDPDLVAWAYALTRDVALDDTPDLQALRGALHRPSGGAAAALRDQGRQRRRHDLLVRRAADRLGERLDELLDDGRGQLRDQRHGGQRHAAGADLARPGGPGRPRSRAGAAHRQQLHDAASSASRQRRASPARRAACPPSCRPSKPPGGSATRWSRRWRSTGGAMRSGRRSRVSRGSRGSG